MIIFSDHSRPAPLNKWCKRAVFFGLTLVILTVVASITSGCDSKSSTVMQKPIAVVAKDIVDMFDDVSMTELTLDNLNDYYDLDTSTLKDFSVYIEGSGGFADEVAIFQSDSNDVKKAIDKRLERRKKDFNGYNVDELTRLDNAEIVTKGDYTILLVTSDNRSALKIFEDAFKK